MIPVNKIEYLIKRYNELEKELSSGSVDKKKYASKSKEIWGIPCPIFIRSIAMEGGIGPVAGSSHHSIYHHLPTSLLQIYQMVMRLLYHYLHS